MLHTGGVTRRIPEVVQLFPNFSYDYIDDFRYPTNFDAAVGKRSFCTIIKMLKILLKVFSLVETSNNDDEFRKIKFWTISLRGHYSYRTISRDNLLEIDKAILRITPKYKLSSNKSCVIHYRLGDLLSLQDKNPISINSIIQEYQNLEHEYKFSELVIFSDSPEVAQIRFLDLVTTPLKVPDVMTIEVMASSSSAQYFIGTSSKISFWIAGIRAAAHQLPSSLPIHNAKEYKSLFGGVENSVKGYGSS